MARSRILCQALATGLVLTSGGCSGSQPNCYDVDCVEGSPQGKLGGQQGATTVTATFPNPCEIDVDFGNAPIGLRDQATVEITNVGSGALDLSQVNPTLDPEFGLSYGTQQPIEPGEFGEFGLSFQPYKVGTVTYAFTIQPDGWNSTCPSGAPNASITVKLTGTGIQLSLVVQPDVL